MVDRLTLSVVIPCYNEEKRIPVFEASWKKFLQDFSVPLFESFNGVELIFINDGSKDRTEFVLTETLKNLVDERVSVRFESFSRNRGKGAAVRKGLQLVHGGWVLITDVDLSSPLPQLFELMKARVDFALGSRGLRKSKILRAQSHGRSSLGRLFNLWMRLITGIPFKDTQCGFKLLKRDLAQKASEQLIENRFAFDVELVLIAHKLHASMAEVPVEWAHREGSHVHLLKDGIPMLLQLISITLRHGRWHSRNS